MTKRHTLKLAEERLNQEVYDAYPQLITALMEWALHVTVFPLDHMASANKRLGDTWAYVKPGKKSIPVNPTALKGQHDLITAVLAFRSACSRITLDEEETPA